MKSIKRLSLIILSLVLTFSMLSVSAADDITIIKEIDPETLDWTAEEVAYIDFSEIEEISLADGAEGHGITLLPNNGATSWKAANRLSSDGYLLFGKEANTDGGDPEILDFGNVYLRLDIPLAEKAATPYIIKVDYYGGGTGVDSGSYITFCYNNSERPEYTTPRYTYGATYNSGKVESMYVLLSDANLSENVGTPKGDIRMNTWSGAQLKIRRISIMEYSPLVTPELIEVYKGPEREIASIDFSAFSETDITSGSFAGDGITLLTTQATGTAMASNLMSDGYLLLGKQARQTGPDTYANGAIYLKLELPLADKGNTSYAVKVEYYGGGIGTDSGSYIDLRYNSTSSTAASKRNTYGATYNSGKLETMYFLLDNADFSETIQNSTCGADFRLETWCGNGSTTGAQLKIKSVSVVEYDSSKAIENAEKLFNIYSGGNIPTDTVLIDMNTGEYAGMSYPSSVNVYKLIDLDDTEHFVALPAYDENGLGTLGITVSSEDTFVKNAEQAEITVYYWDVGTGNFNIEYNSSDSGAYKRTETVALEDSKELKSHTFALTSTAFTGAQTGGFDFKLLTYQPDFCIEKIVLTAAAKAGDVNMDGTVASADIAALAQHLMGSAACENTDVNEDGDTNILDLIRIKKLLAE